MATHKTGGEVDAFCNRCKMALAHTIIAMVGEKVARVQCNTCGGQHAYKGTAAPKPAKPRAAAKPRGTAASRASVSFDTLLASKDTTKAKRYSPNDTYAVDDVIDHPTFGYGIVTNVRADKVGVIFKSSEKTLVHGRGLGEPQARPAYSHPPRPAAYRAEDAEDAEVAPAPAPSEGPNDAEHEHEQELPT